MIAQSNVVLSFILIALGCLGVILSFLVPDRRKSMISLALAGIIVLVGVIYLGSSGVESWRWKRRLQTLRQQRPQMDMEKLREDFQKRADEAQNKMKEAPKK